MCLYLATFHGIGYYLSIVYIYASETLGLGSCSTCVYICAYKIIKIAETFKAHQH